MEEIESMNRTPGAARRLTTEARISYPGDAALAGPARDVSTTLSALCDGGFLESVEDLELGLRVDVFEPARVAVVVGRSQDIGRVTNAGLATADGVSPSPSMTVAISAMKTLTTWTTMRC